MKVLRPTSPAEAIAMKAEYGASRFVAGGTGLQLEWARGLPKPDVMIDMVRIAGLTGVGVADGMIRIGALGPLNTLIASPDIAARLPLLHQALKSVAGPAVRNLATIGGNVAGRTGCLLPALLVLKADLEIVDADGVRRMALADWLGTPVDGTTLITAIHLPAQQAGHPLLRTYARRDLV